VLQYLTRSINSTLHRLASETKRAKWVLYYKRCHTQWTYCELGQAQIVVSTFGKG
jgi:hypothetical protein